MSKDPAFLFYSQDFIMGTTLMNNEQIGIYIKLLCIQHQHGGLIDKVSFNSMVGNAELLRNKFIETDGGFFNERLMKEMEIRAKKCSNLSNNAKVRWDKHKQCKSNAIACDLHMPIEDEDESESIKAFNKGKQVKFDFDSLWNDYPSKVGKTAAEKYFKNTVKTNDDFADIKKALLNYKQSERVKKGFIQNGSTWFNNWKDWINYEERTLNETTNAKPKRML